MDEDAFNLSVRKFLKQLGGDERLGARATVVVEGLDHEIVIEGEIALSGKTQPG